MRKRCLNELKIAYFLLKTGKGLHDWLHLKERAIRKKPDRKHELQLQKQGLITPSVYLKNWKINIFLQTEQIEPGMKNLLRRTKNWLCLNAKKTLSQHEVRICLLVHPFKIQWAALKNRYAVWFCLSKVYPSVTESAFSSLQHLQQKNRKWTEISELRQNKSKILCSLNYKNNLQPNFANN